MRIHRAMMIGSLLPTSLWIWASSRPVRSFPFGAMVIPSGPGGLQQRLRELQAFQAHSFTHLPLPHAKPGYRQVVAGRDHR